MKIVMIGKNDTWGTMVFWQNTLENKMKYYMAHPAGGYIDNSDFNKNLIQSLEEADVIFLHVAIRHPNRGHPIKLMFHGIDFSKYKHKTIIYICGDREAKYNLKEFSKVYCDYNRLVALTPDIATILNIPFLPAPIMPTKNIKTYKDINSPKEILTVTRLHGQWEKIDSDEVDFFEFGKYLHHETKQNFIYNITPVSFYSSVEMKNKNPKTYIFYDNKNGCYSHLALLSAYQKLATISSLNNEYMPKFIEFTKTWTLPFINILNLADLKYNLEILTKNPEFIKDEAERAHRWMQEFWNQNKHIYNLNDILNKFGFRGRI